MWKSWVLVFLGLGVLAAEIHTFLGEQVADNDEEASEAFPSSSNSLEAAPPYLESETVPEVTSPHPEPLVTVTVAEPLVTSQEAEQEESGVLVVLVICLASFLSVYVIYSLFGRKKERRRSTELRTYRRVGAED